VRSFYNSLLADFETRLANLQPTEAYTALRKIAQVMAQPSTDLAALLRSPVWSSPRQRSGRLLDDLSHAYGLYSNGAEREAFEIAQTVYSAAEVTMDILATLDALHLIGRIHYDRDRLSEANECFGEEMDRSLVFSVVPAFFRAVHETSRVWPSRHDPLRAEFGYRFAWDFYTARMMLMGPFAQSDAPGSDLQNARAAIRSIRSISATYFMFERGPVEGDALIERLASPFFSLRDQSGPIFLEARGLATASISSIPKHRGLLARLASRAMAFHRTYPNMSSFMLEEAEYVAGLEGDAFPRALRRILTQPAERRHLRSSSFYKPSAVVGMSGMHDAPFSTPASAAATASVLRRYLKDADGQGRYVYRGQTVDYSGPLLPSAFRPILTEKYGRVTMGADGLFGASSLRKCGKLFYGEYNACFQQYADPISHLLGSASSEEINEVALLYKRILDDPFIGLKQEGSAFVPWLEALGRVLSAREYDRFSRNKDHWMLRINNYQRRIYRMDRFIALFGYTLGTTIAQQYGFSSEGLDATKNIDVAFFFATHNSTDFREIVQEGIGVVYRIPFEPNDVASVPINHYNYYTLPSIVDAKDVVYRFEVEGLTSTDSRMCVDTYVGASLIDGFQDSNLLVLPDAFYRTSRIDKQDAVIIFPDEIRQDDMERSQGVDGIRFPKYRYVEDLAAREGVQKFFFRHTGNLPSEVAKIKREELWPRDDLLLDVVVRIVLGDYRMRDNHPKRPDLIDGGFDNEEFARSASERYWADRPTFFTEYERLVAGLGALTF
jgi:hypothetical protein